MPNDLITSRLFGKVPFAGSSTGWHVMLAGQELGPISADALIDLAESGKINEGDLVMEVGGVWIKARDASILQRSFATRDTQSAGPVNIENVWARLAPYHGYAPAALLVIAIVVGVGIALVGAMKPANANGLGGTSWQGSENLANFGYLAFDLRSNGNAVMTDAARHANGPVHGKWSQNGSQVTITFTNCVYRGTIENGAIAGTATSDFGPSWSFSVTKR